MLGVPPGSAKRQLGEVICGDIVRDFRGQFILVLVNLFSEIARNDLKILSHHLTGR